MLKALVILAVSAPWVMSHVRFSRINQNGTIIKMRLRSQLLTNTRIKRVKGRPTIKACAATLSRSSCVGNAVIGKPTKNQTKGKNQKSRANQRGGLFKNCKTGSNFCISLLLHKPWKEDLCPLFFERVNRC
ncbi:MAG: hypothetical protein QG574_4212 [Cyanobacteriota bacterium erpe_2018_sw_21hr_WHONDRS-SW48-000092_B_bin.40]|nr:hypothetical protein [Cyanobacteriota bacterium erpe_2018_sw_21hr_WHONDRS-SW48-000092_B_bin.40]